MINAWNATKDMPEVVILSRAYREGRVAAVDSQMIDALSQAGFQLWHCARVEEILPVIASGGNQIIVIDAIGNDETDGCALVYGVRANFHGGIVLFAKASSEDRERGLNSGADLVLSASNSHAEVIAYLHALNRRILVQLRSQKNQRNVPGCDRP